jgi:Zn-dependent metalloprotease
MKVTLSPMNSITTAATHRSEEDDARARNDAKRLQVKRTQSSQQTVEQRHQEEAAQQLSAAMSKVIEQEQTKRTRRESLDGFEGFDTETDTSSSNKLSEQIKRSQAQSEFFPEALKPKSHTASYYASMHASSSEQALSNQQAISNEQALSNSQPNSSEQIPIQEALSQFEAILNGESSRGLLQEAFSGLKNVLLAYEALEAADSKNQLNQTARQKLAHDLEFLEGYLEASKTSDSFRSNAEDTLNRLRQRLLVDTIPVKALTEEAGQQMVLAHDGGVHVAAVADGPLDKSNERLVRVKRRQAAQAEADLKLENLPSSMAGLTSQNEMRAPQKTSLDKDLKKRSEDTLPLVTLRSI